MRISSYIRMSLIPALVALSLAAAGCGGSSSSSSSQETTTAVKVQVNTKFKGSPKIVNYGKNAPAAEREAASEVLEASLKAREEGDFAAQCATLSIVSMREVTGLKLRGAVAKECPTDLEKLAQPLKATKVARKNNMAEPVAVFRVKGSKGIALYHGNDGHDYAVPLEKENGEWKVRSLVTPRLS